MYLAGANKQNSFDVSIIYAFILVILFIFKLSHLHSGFLSSTMRFLMESSAMLKVILSYFLSIATIQLVYLVPPNLTPPSF